MDKLWSYYKSNRRGEMNLPLEKRTIYILVAIGHTFITSSGVGSTPCLAQGQVGGVATIICARAKSRWRIDTDPSFLSSSPA